MLLKLQNKLNISEWQVPPCRIREFFSRCTKYCICVPVVNEGERLKKQLDRMLPYSRMVDVMIVDKGSTDGSTDPGFLQSKNVRVLVTLRGPGRQGSQLRAGFSFAMREGYQGIVIIDGNNKDGVEAIPDFIKELEKGYDYIQGSRFIKGGKHINTPFLRLLGIRFVASPLLSLAAGYFYTDVTNGFRAVSRRYVLHPRSCLFRDKFIGYEFLLYLTMRAGQLGLKTKEIPVRREYPRGVIPTKMKGIGGNLNMLLTLLRAALGYYQP